MVNFEQYPHYLYKRTDGDSQRNANGSWVEATHQWEPAGRCRTETNGKGNSITTADGRALIFSALIQMPTGTPRINEGTEIAVTNRPLTREERQTTFEQSWKQLKAAGVLLEKAQIAKFDSNRLHCRAWV